VLWCGVTLSPSTDRRLHGGAGPRLFERAEFLAELEAVFSQALPVPGGCLLVDGPWGSGRTALLNSACELAGRYGCLVLRARGSENEGAAPFVVLAGLVDSAIAALPARSAALGPAEALKAQLTASGAEGLPGAVSDAVTSFLIALRRQGPVLVAIDDADLADVATVEVLQTTLRRVNDRQLWYLSSGLPQGRPVQSRLVRAGSRQFTLGPLQVESVRRMLGGVMGEGPDEAFVRACWAATGGLPLFLKGLISSLRDLGVRPSAAAAATIERTPAPRITRLVLSKLAALSPTSVRYLQVSAVLGDGADAGVAGVLAGIDAATAEQAARPAARLGLIGSDLPVVFCAPVVRWAIYQSMPVVTRSKLHAKAAHLLLERGADIHEVAEHLLETGPVGDPVVAEQLERVGRSSLEAGDTSLARRCFERALEEFPPAQRRGSAYLDLAAAVVDQPLSALGHFRRALEIGAGDDVRVVEVAIALLRSVVDKPQLIREASESLWGVRDRLSTVPGDLRLQFELALATVAMTPEQRSMAHGRIQAALVDRQLSPAMAGDARTFVDISDPAALPALPASDQVGRLLAVVSVDGLLSADPAVERIQTAAVVAVLCADRFDEVQALLEMALDRARLEDKRTAEIRVTYLLATALLWRGSLHAAEREFRSGRYGGTATAVKYQGLHALGLVDTLVQQGRIDEARRRFEGLAQSSFDDATFRSWALVERGRLTLVGGSPLAALEDFYRAGDGEGTGIANPALTSWRADATMALASMGEGDEADRLADEHLHLARHYGTARMIGIGLRAKAAASEDADQKIAYLYEAVELLASSPARLEAARALVELGAILVEVDRKEEARDILRRGGQMASTCGARTLMEVAWAQLRSAGARSRRVGHDQLDSLSPAEFRVVRLAASGKTNQVIADELFLAPKTVEGHLARVFKKLGISSRQELVGPLAGLGHTELIDETA
jgi:DNA-binding CsgD family transcriptional regulator